MACGSRCNSQLQRGANGLVEMGCRENALLVRFAVRVAVLV
jgi:hypothetical protein